MRDGDSVPDGLGPNGEPAYYLNDLDEVAAFLDAEQKRQIAAAEARGDWAEVERLRNL